MLMYDNYFSVIVARIKKSLFFYENSFSSMSFSIFKIANVLNLKFSDQADNLAKKDILL